MSTLDIDTNFRRHVLHYYNRFAHLYDLGEFMRRGTRRKAIMLSGWHPGERILDLCTGTGELALAFAAQGAKVVGSDIARGMLMRAMSKSRNSNLAWAEMDATDLAFAPKSFEISVLSLGLHHMPISIQIRVLEELRRVTRRRVIIIEPHTPTDPRWFPLWVAVASVIDESEYMHEWVRQDLTSTCISAGLQVEFVQVTSFWLHSIVLCNPAMEEG